MGCRILSGKDGACFYDSVTETCFGPLMVSEEEAETFQEWLKIDPRAMIVVELMDELNKFREEQEAEDGKKTS